MSLSAALNIAQSALRNTSLQTNVVSRNVSEASNPDYARREAVTTSLAPGARVAEIRRATADVLFRQNLGALSSSKAQETVADGLNSLQVTLNGEDNASSTANAIGELQEALQLYASTPSNATLAENTVEAARQVARTLNRGSNAVQSFRADTDRQIASEVDSLNGMLADFEKVNGEVVDGTRAGRDVSDALDQRDALLKKISGLVPVSSYTRSSNDMVITTAGGATLFETSARQVAFEPTSSYGSGTEGNPVTIDGVPIEAGKGGNTSADGSLAARLQLRDDVAVQAQAQLDEVARGLVTAFAETDPDGAQPDAPGLFTWPGAPGMPAGGTIEEGLAARIGIHAAMDSTQGGDATLLRDGGANGADYEHNDTGSASYSGLLRGYGERMDEPIAFDTEAGLDDSAGVADYAAQSIGWLESQRQEADRGGENKGALATRTSEALSNATGVNIDDEMSRLLDLEHAYEASARLMRTIDDMLTTLLQSAR